MSVGEHVCAKCQRMTMCKPYRKEDFICVDEDDCRQCLEECEAFRVALRELIQRRGL